MPAAIAPIAFERWRSGTRSRRTSTIGTQIVAEIAPMTNSSTPKVTGPPAPAMAAKATALSHTEPRITRIPPKRRTSHPATAEKVMKPAWMPPVRTPITW